MSGTKALAAALGAVMTLASGASAASDGRAITPARDPAMTLASRSAPSYHVTWYRIRSIPRDELPYVSASLPSKAPPSPSDADGIPMQLVGSTLHYNPVGMAQYAIQYEDAYRRTGDPDYLTIATKVLAKAMARGQTSGDAVFLPYQFDFALHGNAAEVMKAPWYSAMAQGLTLSLAVRLYRDTGDATFRTDAALLFNAFRHLGRGTDPWVSYVDAAGYLWLEEYPEPGSASDNTANGFNFALIGIYEYQQITRSVMVDQILRGALTTMRQYIAAFRNPGTFSDYCLRHHVLSAKYHRIVTWQLEVLARISGDSYFHRMAVAFRADAT